MSYLVEVDSSGEIARWPLAELSLTPAPARPGKTVELGEPAKFDRHAGLL